MRRDDYRALVEQRNEAHGAATVLHEQAEREQRNLTEDEQRRWDEFMRDVQRLTTEIDEARMLLAAEEGARAAGAPGGSAMVRGPLETSWRSAGTDRFDNEIEKAVGSVSKGESRALSTAISVSPGELSTTLFDRLRAASVVLKTGIKTLETEADSVTYPTLTADVAPAWTSEAAAITPSDPTLSTVVAVPRKLAALTQASNELLEDSDPPLAKVLTDHLMKVLALKLDAGILEARAPRPSPRDSRT